MYEKIKKLTKYQFWHNFRDVRFVGFIVFGLLVLLASWSGISVIETNYVLQKQISQASQQNQIQELKNMNLKLQNEYYKTDTYLELTARKQFGRGAPGETLVLVPKSVALSRAQPLPKDTAAQPEAKQEANRPGYRKNFNAWMDFFFREG